VRKLYLPRSGRHFWSRRAYELAYASQRETKFDRALRRARKLRLRHRRALSVYSLIGIGRQSPSQTTCADYSECSCDLLPPSPPGEKATASCDQTRQSIRKPMKWAHHPNLRKRPPTPAKGRGSVQRAIKRAFAATSASELTSTQIYDWAHVRRRLGRRKSMPFGVYSRTLRTLRAMCDPIKRVPPHGAWLWRLRNTADD